MLKKAQRGSLYRLNGSFWWVETADGWRTSYRIEPQGLQPVVAEIRIFPAARFNANDPVWQPQPAATPEGGVPSGLLKSASLSTPFTGLTAAELLDIQKALGPALSGQVGLAGATPATASGADKLRAQVAAMYSVAVQQTRNVNALIAEALGYSEAKGYMDGPRRVTDLVSDARNKLGFLTRTGQGKGGGALTAAGRSVLTDDEYLAAVRKIEKVIEQSRKANR